MPKMEFNLGYLKIFMLNYTIKNGRDSNCISNVLTSNS